MREYKGLKIEFCKKKFLNRLINGCTQEKNSTYLFFPPYKCKKACKFNSTLT